MDYPPEHKRRPLVALGGVASAYLLYCGARSVGVVPFRFSCPFWSLTGIPCPLCGLTRSIAALMSGDIQHAVALHPLGPIALVALVLSALLALAILAGYLRPAARSWPGLGWARAKPRSPRDGDHA